MKIRDYTVLEATELLDLKKKVLNHAGRGWEPLGGPFLVPFAAGHGPVFQTPEGPETGADGWIFVNFCQAMVLAGEIWTLDTPRRIGTPNNIEVLLHCHCSPEPHPRIHAPAVADAIAFLEASGAIERDPYPGSFRTTPLGRRWVASLCNVGLPLSDKEKK